MLACVNSDDRIAMAVPVCNEGSFSYRHLLRALYAHPYLHRYQVHSIMFREDEPLVERMKPLLRSDEHMPSDLEVSLSIRMFFLGIFKENA